ncbi:hypothetical protein [Opitutus sp. GAS368]|uniref:hypothetical protein n=1 Tax=Opitutus sp. GAS368 TaxID=1882749 RepID=UPI00087AEDED|nr:hypothetical protein [Opitutus sp. GAS368]SDR65332.1 hypothetical protein SAMN05444173_0033 [Opitutus sp. GAS368]
MNHLLLPRRLLVLFAVSAALLLRAAEPAKPVDQPKPAEPAKADPALTPADQEVLKLPKVEVTSARIKAIDAELKKIDKQIAREKKNIKGTDLDKSLNSDKLAKSAAIFGGNSASHMEAVAATRVALLENEREMLERLKFPRTEEDKALIEKELENIRKTRRELDDAAKQR